MKRNTAVLLSVVIIAAAGGMVWAQNPTASPAFEVASIRPALPPTPETVRSGQFHAGARVDGAHLDFGYVSLFSLLPHAFGREALPDIRCVVEPRFDVEHPRQPAFRHIGGSDTSNDCRGYCRTDSR
jgi:hypothetical protein